MAFSGCSLILGRALGKLVPPKDTGWWRLQQVHLALRLSSRSMLVGASLNGAVRNGPSLQVSAFPPAFTGARSWTQSTSSFYWSMDACARASAMFHSTVCVHLPALNYAADHLARFLCSCFFWCSLSHRIGETDPETLSSSAQYLMPFSSA